MFDLEPYQMDVKGPILYDMLGETMYMKQPEGFEEGKNMVWKLIKSPYGL